MGKAPRHCPQWPTGEAYQSRAGRRPVLPAIRRRHLSDPLRRRATVGRSAGGVESRRAFVRARFGRRVRRVERRARAATHVRVTAVDWPGVIPITQKVTARFGVADRFRFVAGDLLEANVGSGHAIVTAGHILHSEGEARSRLLLEKAFDALAPGGTIAIAEILVDANRTAPLPALIFAVNMLVNSDQGDTFSLGEISGWLRDAGFEQVRTVEAP